MSGASLEILIAPWHCRLVLRHMVFYSSRSLQSSQHPQIINDLKIFLCSRCFNRLLGGTGLARYTLLDCQSKYWGKRFYFFFKRGLRMLSVFNRCIFFFFLLHVFSKLSPQKCWCISSDLWCAAEVYQRAVFQEKGITGSHRNSKLFYGSRPPTKHGHDSDLHSALHRVSLSRGLAKPCSLTCGTVTSQVVTMIHCSADRGAQSRKAVMTSHPDRELYVFLMGCSLKFCSDSCPLAGS